MTTRNVVAVEDDMFIKFDEKGINNLLSLHFMVKSRMTYIHIGAGSGGEGGAQGGTIELSAIQQNCGILIEGHGKS